MLLTSLEEVLRARLAGTLPGVDAHRRFAPRPPRTRPVDVGPQPRTAAALLLLYPLGDEVALPLTRRSGSLRRHAGQISLPGGALDPGESLAEAALREAREEIGVEPSAVSVIGELTPVHITVSGFTLHPVVATTARRPAFVPAPDEVDEVLEVAVEHLRDASRLKRGTRTRDGVLVEYPYFDLLGQQVWGATAMVLGEFVALLEREHQM